MTATKIFAARTSLGVMRLRDLTHLPPPIVVGSSADLKVGQFAYAIGNPFGFEQSLTTGVISALSRRLPTSSGREIPMRSRPMRLWRSHTRVIKYRPDADSRGCLAGACKRRRVRS
jgi:hypothetical protein